MKYNKLIDHTLLKQDATPEQIVKICEEAKEFDFMSVCVNPAYVPLAHECLMRSDVKVCTVIGFPLGMNLTETKVAEAKQAIEAGAEEIDMVLNVGMLKAGKDDYVQNEIKLLKEVGSSFSYITNGEGTAKNYLPGLLSTNDPKKQIVFTFVREEKSKEVCEILENRFSTSKSAKGVSLSVKLTSVAGVSVYRFLTNTRKVKKVNSND